MEISVVGFIFSLLGALLAGAVAAFFITRHIFKKQFEQNNPFNNEQMIRTMFSSMGVTPSEKKVRQVMASMQAEQGKAKGDKFVKPTENNRGKNDKKNGKK